MPNPDSCTATNNPSLDDLVGTKKERLRDRQADRLGSLEIDHQRDFGRLLDGKIGRPGTLQNLIDVGGGARLEIKIIYVTIRPPASVTWIE